MGPIARILVFLLGLCPSVRQVTQTVDQQDLEDEYSEELMREFLDSLDKEAFENWRERLENCFNLDPTQHHHDHSS